MVLASVLLAGFAARNLATPLHGRAERGFSRITLERHPFIVVGLDVLLDVLFAK